MLDILVASRPRRQVKPASFVGASLLHAAAFVLCVIGTRTTVKVVSRAVDDTTLIFLPRLGPPAVNRAAPPHAVGGGGGGGQGGAIVLSADPPPRGFQVIDVVSAVPTGIPGVDPNERILDPRDFTGRGVEGGLGWGVVGGTGSTDQPVPDAGPSDALYAAELSDARFIPAELVVQPRFNYPRALLAAGVTGRVTLKFIVDTLGMVEPASVEVLATTHEAFAMAAREGIGEARFTPARYGEHAVRQTTRLPVSFVLHSSEDKS